MHPKKPSVKLWIWKRIIKEENAPKNANNESLIKKLKRFV